MDTIVYLSTSGLQMIQGNIEKNKIHISSYKNYAFIEGTMLDGKVLDEQSVINALLELKKNNIDKVKLVVDSGQILLKSTMLPKVNHQQLIQFVRDEFVEVEGQYQDLLYDYAVLKDEVPFKDGQLVLCAALEREFIKSYLDLFEQANIIVTSIDLLTNAVIKLAESIDELKNKSYVISSINGQDVNHYLFIHGQYEITNRTRIFSQRGTVSFITELSNSLTKLLQFVKGTYKDEVLSMVYFAGLETYEEELLMTTISSNLDINTACFEPKNYISDNQDFKIHKYLLVGSLWRR